jgi:hypothetical protein
VLIFQEYELDVEMTKTMGQGMGMEWGVGTAEQASRVQQQGKTIPIPNTTLPHTLDRNLEERDGLSVIALQVAFALQQMQNGEEARCEEGGGGEGRNKERIFYLKYIHIG